MADIITGQSASEVTISVEGEAVATLPAGQFSYSIPQAIIDAMPADDIQVQVSNGIDTVEIGPLRKVDAPTAGVVAPVQFSQILNRFVSKAEAETGVTIGAPGGPASSDQLELTRINDQSLIAIVSSDASGVWSYTLQGDEITETVSSGNRAVQYRIYDPDGDTEAFQSIEYHDYEPRVTVTQAGFSTDSTGATVTVASDALSFADPEETEVYVEILNGSGVQQHDELKEVETDNAGGTFAIPLGVAQAAANAGDYTIEGYVKSRRFKNESPFSLAVNVTNTTNTTPGGSTTGPYPDSSAVAAGWSLPSKGATTTASGRTVLYVDNVRSKYSKINSFSGATHFVSHGGSVYTIAGTKVADVPFGSTCSASFVTGGRIFGLQGTRLMQYDVGGSNTELFNFASVGASGSLAFGGNEGSQSVDDNVFVVTQGDPISRAWVWVRGTGVVASLTAAQIVGDGGAPTNDVDSVTLSPLGNYIIAANRKHSLVRYNQNGSSPIVLGTRKNGGIQRLKAEHGVHIPMPGNKQARVQAHWGGIAVVDLDDPTVVYDADIGGHGHYSGGAIARPGYFVMAPEAKNGDEVRGYLLDFSMWTGASESNKDNSNLGFSLGAVSLPSVERWVHAEYTGEVYPGPTPTVNAAGNRVLFNRYDSEFKMCMVYQT